MDPPTNPDVGSLEHLVSQLDDAGRDFERLAAWFLENDPEYAAIFKRVWQRKDWPGCWGRDKGIDLIAEKRNGLVVAIQAKNYAEQHWITKKDIDTFLSESGRPGIDERLLIATTDRVAESALDVMDGQEKSVSRCLRSRLAEAQVTWPASPRELDTGQRLPPKTPRPHQEEALSAIEDALRAHDRCRVIMACGTGKTLVGLWAAERFGSRLSLVLVPSLALLRQIAQDWAANAAQDQSTLKVCSDRTLSGDEGSALIDAADLGPDVTTDPAVIRAFLNNDGPRVVFATYHSSPQIAEAMASDCNAAFDIAICDEAHWCAGLAGKSPKTVLDDDKIRARKRVFFTATPTIYPPHEIVRVAGKKMTVVSMGDRRLFGPEVHRLSFADAIDRGLLCPYQVVVMPVSDADVQELIEQRTQVTTDGGDTRIDAYSLATQIACLRAMRDYGCRRMVSFHPRIARSKVFSEQFQQAVDLVAPAERPDGPVWAAHVDGDSMPRSTRNRVMATFAHQDGTHRLISNVKVLSEGVDVPGIDAITMIDTRRGRAQVIQIVGRAVRHAPGKTVGTIVLPVLVRAGEDPREALARSDHRPIMNLLAALRATDPDIERSVDDLWVQVDPDTGEAPAHRRFILNIPAEVGPEFADAVNVMLVDALAPSQRRKVPVSAKPAAPRPQAEVISYEGRGPDVAELLAEGLEALHDHRGRRHGLPLGHVPRETIWFGYRFPLTRWWSLLVEAWNTSDVTEDIKYELADAVTWLSIDEGKYPAIRGELRRRTSLPLASHIDAWLGDFHSNAREELQLLAENGAIGPGSVLSTERLCAAFDGPSMDSEERARVVCKALLIAGDECNRRALPKFFAQGFMEAVETLRSSKPSAVAASRLERSAIGQHVAGSQIAEPFFADVRRARGLPARAPRRRDSRRRGTSGRRSPA